MVNEPAIAHGVAPVAGMLATIDLNHEPLLSADKIYNIGADCLLTHELESTK